MTQTQDELKNEKTKHVPKWYRTQHFCVQTPLNIYQFPSNFSVPQNDVSIISSFFHLHLKRLHFDFKVSFWPIQDLMGEKHGDFLLIEIENWETGNNIQ